jgi:hypothetical protein
MQGISIPFFTEDGKIYIFTTYEKAAKASKEMDSHIVRDENLISAVKFEKPVYVGKINKGNNDLKMEDDPLEVVATLENILENAKILGIKAVVFNYISEDELEISLEDLMTKLDITGGQAKIVLSQDEKQAIEEKQVQIAPRFNFINILNYKNPFSLDKMKEVDLAAKLFDDAVDNLEEELKPLEYHELAYMSHELLREYIPMAQNMENKALEDNFKGYHDTLITVASAKLAKDLKEGKAFFLILIPTGEEGKMKVQKDENGVVPVIYTEFFATNNVNPLCVINGLDVFKQFLLTEKPTALQISAGPTATFVVPIEDITKAVDAELEKK